MDTGAVSRRRGALSGAQVEGDLPDLAGLRDSRERLNDQLRGDDPTSHRGERRRRHDVITEGQRNNLLPGHDEEPDARRLVPARAALDERQGGADLRLGAEVEL